MAKLAAGDAGRETVVADGNLLIYELIGKVVGSLGHSANEDTYALLGSEILDIVSRSHNLFVKTECNLAAVGREVVRNGVLDDTQQLFLRVRRSDGQTMKELHHQTGEALEGSRNSHGR